MRPRLYAAVGNPAKKQLERFIRRRKRLLRRYALFRFAVRCIEALGAFVRAPAPIAVIHRIRNKCAKRSETHRVVFRRLVFPERPVSVLRALETDSPICSTMIHAGSPIHHSSASLDSPSIYPNRFEIRPRCQKEGSVLKSGRREPKPARIGKRNSRAESPSPLYNATLSVIVPTKRSSLIRRHSAGVTIRTAR